MKQSGWRAVLLRFFIELAVYGLLLLAYFLLVLRYLAEPLGRLFRSNLALYGLLGLGLIIGQAAVLDLVTSFLVEQLRLERLH
jgi:hypothetical protein